MPINPNFVFTDPVAAKQVMTLAQIMAQERSDKAKTEASQQIARENAAQQRAMTQSQMAQQSNEAEKARLARAAETDKILSSQEKVAGINASRYKDMDKTKEETQTFNLIQQDIDSGDPPPDSEFEARTAGLSKQLKDTLNARRKDKIREMNALADIGEASAVDFTNQIDNGAKPEEVAKAINQTHKGLITWNPQLRAYQSLYQRPRRDPVAPTSPTVTPIDALRGRVAPPPFNPTPRDTGVMFGPQPPPPPVPNDIYGPTEDLSGREVPSFYVPQF